MTPTPQEAGHVEEPNFDKVAGERVVISGISGLYPKSHNVKELCDILYNKVNPISTEGNRWTYSHPEVSQYTGNVPDLNLFDAQFFGVHYRLATSMDAMSRKILEQTYQAIYDAGLSPEHISGKKIGVYVGTCFSETEKACFYVACNRTGFGIAGCSKAMFANRISYWMNAKGPSVSIDEACGSSTVALEQAYQALSRGECEAAIVGGANISLHPQSMVHYGRITKICMDGKTKSFDENADGCAKTEAINVLFLQKAKDALRIYAEVLHVKNEFLTLGHGNTPQFGFTRNPSVVGEFLNKFYDEAGVPPQAVEYVEACGSEVMLKRININKKFYVLGYESGVAVALELASVLEGHGYDGVVYCIGAAPEQFIAVLAKELREFRSTEALEDAVLHHVSSLMGGGEIDLSECVNWQDKAALCARALMGHAQQSAQYVRGQFNAARARLLQVMNYTPLATPLRSQLVLLRPSNIEAAYPEPLQKYSQRTVVVHTLRNSLAHSLKDLRCAAIINQHLDPEVLEAFEKKNLCEKYLLAADCFMIEGIGNGETE